MSEITPGFERMETQLMREAVRSAGELYIEEIARNAVKHYPNDKAKQKEFVTNTWAFASTFDLFHLLNEANLISLWNRIRDSVALSPTVLNTAVKLRGMYSEADWSSLTHQMAAGLDILSPVQHSVMDDTATKPMQTNTGAFQRLSANTWVMPLVLLSYAPLLSMPATLSALLLAVEKATPKGPVS